MTLPATVAELVREFRTNGRIVIVGASLAGLRAAEALREEGLTGSLTIIGDEPYEPYDRPPLSKQVLKGWVPADHTALPRMRAVDADWRLGVAATGLDRAAKQVRLADGERVGYDRLLIATGTRARPWPNPAEAALQGVHTIRSRDDAAQLQKELAEPPSRVLVIGAGFIGSEVASVCRELDIPVTVVERGSAPLSGALGGVIGEIAARMQRDHGVDLRCGLGVSSLEGDVGGHVRRARLSDGAVVDADVVVASLGSIRNVEWLEGAGLAAGFWGVGCDAGGRQIRTPSTKNCARHRWRVSRTEPTSSAPTGRSSRCCTTPGSVRIHARVPPPRPRPRRRAQARDRRSRRPSPASSPAIHPSTTGIAG